MGKFKEMDLLRQEREAFDADYPMEPTPRADMWIAWNSEDGFTFWDSEYAARLCTATNSIEWPVQYVMQKVNIQTQIVKDNLQPAPNCTRSHPHENMDAMCELRTEIARLTNENARLKAQPAPVQSLECAHCHVTIDTLNDKVMYLIDENQRLRADMKFNTPPAAPEKG